MKLKQRVKRVLKGYPTLTGSIVRIEGAAHYVLWDHEANGVECFFTGKTVPASPMPYLQSEIKPA